MIYQLNVGGLGDDFKVKYTRVLKDLLESAPSDSCACSLIVKFRGGFLGVLDIFSSERLFSAKSHGKDLNGLVENMLTQIREQYKKWHSERKIAV